MQLDLKRCTLNTLLLDSQQVGLVKTSQSELKSVKISSKNSSEKVLKA
jgi:hypothetical protein